MGREWGAGGVVFPVDKVEPLTLRCSGLREITPVVDHRPVNRQVIKHFLGDEPEETNGKGGCHQERRRAEGGGGCCGLRSGLVGWEGLVGNAPLGGLGSWRGTWTLPGPDPHFRSVQQSPLPAENRGPLGHHRGVPWGLGAGMAVHLTL